MSWVIFLSKSDYLVCAVLLCLVVCLTLLAPFLNSVIVIINVHVHCYCYCYCDCIHVYTCGVCVVCSACSVVSRLFPMWPSRQCGCLSPRHMTVM